MNMDLIFGFFVGGTAGSFLAGVVVSSSMSETIDSLRNLVRHCWVHSGYEDCGFKQMDKKQRMLYTDITMEDRE